MKRSKTICTRCLEPREIGKSFIVIDGVSSYLCLDCLDEYCQIKPLVDTFPRKEQAKIFKDFCRGQILIKGDEDRENLQILWAQ